jgi:hypothetical protein
MLATRYQLIELAKGFQKSIGSGRFRAKTRSVEAFASGAPISRYARAKEFFHVWYMMVHRPHATLSGLIKLISCGHSMWEGEGKGPESHGSQVGPLAADWRVAGVLAQRSARRGRKRHCRRRRRAAAATAAAAAAAAAGQLKLQLKLNHGLPPPDTNTSLRPMTAGQSWV